jgi:hypothetical protein
MVSGMVDLNDLKIDLSRVTIREYRALFDKGQPQDEEDATIAKACGITVDELLDLSQPEYRRLCKRFFDTAREPLADPN